MKAYIHIPFCVSRCSYCDFYSHTDETEKEAFLSALQTELRLRYAELPTGQSLDTIYIGGGTPSRLSIEELRRLFDAIYDLYPVESTAEVTLEANPDDLSITYIRGLRQLPINRVSIGIQSFNDHELKAINRRHNAQQARLSIQHLREAGLHNISIDLMYGLPAQTVQGWQQSLHEVLEIIHPPHISAYHLIYEEGTPMQRALIRGDINAVDEELSLTFFRMLIDQARAAGYEQYEISNFALPDFHSRHNSAYWQALPYLGFGPSAHSYDGVNGRSYNAPDLHEYIRQLAQGEPLRIYEELSTRDLYNEAIMCGLRTARGISLSRLQAIAPTYFVRTMHTAQDYIKHGLLYTDCDPDQMGDTSIKLSESGLFVSDSIMASLFAD